MNPTNSTHFLAAPDAIRIFWGYKLDSVSQEQFNKDLGETFMPGTPAVLAPIGLNSYLPAVLNLNHSSKYPDEVALIVYPSLQLYQEARQDNLLGRIYTFSHMGVFDMARSGGQWPGTLENPIKHPTQDRWAWRVFDRALDWQKGQARLITLTSEQVNLFEFLTTFSSSARALLEKQGVDEMIVQCTPAFASIWLYSTTSGLRFPLESISLGDPQIQVENDLYSEPVYMRRGNETTTIDGARFIQFRFQREQRYYL